MQKAKTNVDLIEEIMKVIPDFFLIVISVINSDISLKF